MTILHELYNAKLITPPEFVVNNLCLLVHGGSFAYGVSTEQSDYDLLGVCIPDKKYLYGDGILGFDEIPIFNEYQQHHINFNSIEYDIKIYSLPRIFKLAAQGNPNILDIIATPNHAVLFENKIGRKIRENRHIFYSCECVSRFLGFSDSHFKSMENRIKSGQYPEKRKGSYEKWGFDVKDISHCVRSLYAIRDILLDGNYEIDKHSVIIRNIREGHFTYEQCKNIRNDLRNQILDLERVSLLHKFPDIQNIRNLLVNLIGEFYVS